MENLSEEQREQIIRKRQEMLKKMGAPKAGQMIKESVVAGAANSSIAAKLAAIKSGGAKADFNKYINATSKPGVGGSDASGFQGLPEPKIKKGPKSHEEIKPEYKQKLEDFGGPGVANNHELSSIDALFGGDGGSSRGHASNVSNHPINNEMSMDYGGMPTFNPNAFKQKMQSKAAQTNEVGNSPYLQFAGEPPVQNEQFETVQPQFNMNQLQMMMEKIARGVAEKTIKNVLSEYSEQQKSKLQFEWYNKEKSVIKMADGKLYQLTPVQIKKKVS
jgi:hypothetical protein